ncbi:MAG: agmatine deiminase family protein [Elusimicrobiales bacterium]
MKRLLIALLLAASPAAAAESGALAALLGLGGAPAEVPAAAVTKAARAAGPMTENARTGYVVLSTPDYFYGILKMHEAILAKLPKDVKAIIVFPRENPHYQKFKADFDSKRFIAWTYTLESPWTRDFLPEVVVDETGSARMVQFAYYPDRPQSEQFGGELAKGFGLTLEKSKVGLEFGNFIADEQGRIFMTEKVIADNKGWTKAGLEKEILARLRGSRLVWMPVIPGESTGHIDIYAKYFGGGAVVVADSAHPEMKKAMDAAAARFAALGMRVTRLKNADFPAGTIGGATAYSYTNSLRVNDTIFMPVYYSSQYAHTQSFKATDEAAAAAYSGLGFKVVKIPAFDAVQFGGAVHCLTREIPWLPWF